MVNNLETLTNKYAEIEEQFSVVENDRYANLVRANSNQNYPVQRWFHLKEAFSLELVETIITDWNIPIESIHRVLDPFCGIGTSLLATQKLAKKYGKNDLEAFGFERNPFLHFAAKTKLRWNEYDAQLMRLKANHLLNGAFKPPVKSEPALSTLHREDVYEPKVRKQALAFREAIQYHLQNQIERAPLLLGYASILEAISGARKDGRALRIVPNRQRAEITEALTSAWNTIAEDLTLAGQYFEPIPAQVLYGDGRTLLPESIQCDNIGMFELIFYSPPYVNNIDYTEVYKVELWMCGFVDTAESFRNLRYKTFRSHPSIRFPDPITLVKDDRMEEIQTALNILIGALPKNKDLGWRTELFNGYFDDMYISLKHQIDVLSPGGWIFCVVGNSLHGPNDNSEARVPVASDLIIASIARALGLEVKAIQVARYLNRRPPHSKYLRESIIVMRKPENGEVP